MLTYLTARNHSQTSEFNYMSWHELAHEVENPKGGVNNKAELPIIAPHDAPAKTKQSALNHNRFTLLIADIDEGNFTIKEVQDRLICLGFESNRFLIYSTFSHKITKGNLPAENRWRVCIPLDKAVVYDQWEAMQGFLCMELGGDNCAQRAQQIAYLPAVGEGGYEFYVNG